METFYHIFANGDDARNFITSETDMVAAFNRMAVCAFMHPTVHVLAFSIEESHPHMLLRGTSEECTAFKRDYESMTRHYIVSTRGNLYDVLFELEILEILDEDYLLNAASYVIVQPTKDGKQVMPFDYRWGTGSMYFRMEELPPIWLFDEQGELQPCQCFEQFNYRQQHNITHSRNVVPGHWLVCNGLILPTNYVDVRSYEKIFVSFNRYRTFLSAGRKQQQSVVDAMAMARGVNLPDLEARKIAYSIAEKLFGKRDSRWLIPQQRLELAKVLRQEYRLSIRQTATLSRLPEIELRKYLR